MLAGTPVIPLQMLLAALPGWLERQQRDLARFVANSALFHRRLKAPTPIGGLSDGLRDRKGRTDMNRIKSVLVFTGLAACMTAGAPVAKESPEARTPLQQFGGHNRDKTGRPLAITNVRIFDGERMIPRGTVVIWGRTIWQVGEKDKTPSGADVIDGSGATLLPGFIDSHAHDSGFGVERAPRAGDVRQPRNRPHPA
jgi:hypothetical protein